MFFVTRLFCLCSGRTLPRVTLTPRAASTLKSPAAALGDELRGVELPTEVGEQCVSASPKKPDSKKHKRGYAVPGANAPTYTRNKLFRNGFGSHPGLGDSGQDIFMTDTVKAWA